MQGNLDQVHSLHPRSQAVRALFQPNSLPSRALAAVGLLCAADASANSGIPGQLIVAGASVTVNPLQWVVVTMLMCILVEGSIYQYAGLFKRPILASTIANFASLLAGFPLAILGEFDPTHLVLPTIVSILVEGFVLRRLPASVGLSKTATPGRGKVYGTVIAANVVTNLIMVAYLFWLIQYRGTA